MLRTPSLRRESWNVLRGVAFARQTGTGKTALPLAELAVVAATALASWLSRAHPALLAPWGPWDFSWLAFLGCGLSLLWLLRGQRRTVAADRLPGWRLASCVIGIGAIYAVVLTQFAYLAQHMFFFNRTQHAVLHHLGPFLIALAWPGTVIARGMPPWLRRACQAAPLRRLLRAVQRPFVAVLLFEGLLLLWLIPPVTFRAMLDPLLYAVMNASMAIDGLLFWFLVLDPRPYPPAPIGYVARVALAFAIIFPQIAIGTVIGLVPYDLYPIFVLCGRLYPTIGPLQDQQIGGLIVWVPTGMMSAAATLLVLRRMILADEVAVRAAPVPGREASPCWD